MNNNNQVYLEYMPLEKLQRAFRNPKDHDIGTLHESMKRFDFVSPLIINEETGRLVVGHGRLDALQQMKANGQKPPSRIIEKDKSWHVPVIRGVCFKDEKEAEAYILADNRLTELGAWHQDQLVQVLSDLAADEKDLIGIGWDAEDIDELIKANSANAETISGPEAQIDKAEELQNKWQAKRGQVWLIGRHRLMCGDACIEKDVNRLINDFVLLMVTDPPYGQRAAEEGHLAYAVRRVGIVQNDNKADWSDAWCLFNGDVIYCWHAGCHASLVQLGIEATGFEVRCQLIWKKPNFAISRGHYHWRHEPCWYAVRKGKTARWIGDRKQTTIWDINLDHNVQGGHGTQKPLECMARPIRNHDGNVYDPFCGSGTTMVAAEQLGRICYGMEIEPKYVAVTLERMSEMGLEPKLETG